MTQNEAIYDYLKRGHSLTPLQALNRFGTMKLATRIGEIEQRKCVQVDREIVHNTRTKKHYCRYWLKNS